MIVIVRIKNVNIVKDMETSTKLTSNWTIKKTMLNFYELYYFKQKHNNSEMSPVDHFHLSNLIDNKKNEKFTFKTINRNVRVYKTVL
jgi:hypothetical protein